MVTETGKTPGIPTPIPPGLLGSATEGQAKLLIGAVLAAGQNTCSCTACQLLRRFGGFMSKALLEEDSHATG